MFLASAVALTATALSRSSAGEGTKEAASAKPSVARGDRWSKALPRPFVAGLFDIGALARGKMMLGYGRPHFTWAGLELEGVSTTEFGAAVARARAALVLLDIAVAWRHTWAYERGFPSRKSRNTSADLNVGPAASYSSVDVWAWGLAPAPFGYFDWEVEALHVYGVPIGHDVYEEWFRAVIRPGWTTTGRLAYAATFAESRGSAGVMGEWVWTGGRGAVLRVGPLATWAFSQEWDLAAVLTMVVSSPDALDFGDALWGTLRLRYRFSS